MPDRLEERHELQADGLWIPREILEIDGLTIVEKVLLAVITNLSKGKNGCYASNAWFAKQFNVAERTISRGMTKLIDSGFVSFAGINKNHRRVIKSNIKITLKGRRSSKKDSNTQNDETTTDTANKGDSANSRNRKNKNIIESDEGNIDKMSNLDNLSPQPRQIVHGQNVYHKSKEYRVLESKEENIVTNPLSYTPPPDNSANTAAAAKRGRRGTDRHKKNNNNKKSDLKGFDKALYSKLRKSVTRRRLFEYYDNAGLHKKPSELLRELIEKAIKHILESNDHNIRKNYGVSTIKIDKDSLVEQASSEIDLTSFEGMPEGDRRNIIVGMVTTKSTEAVVMYLSSLE